MQTQRHHTSHVKEKKQKKHIPKNIMNSPCGYCNVFSDSRLKNDIAIPCTLSSLHTSLVKLKNKTKSKTKLTFPNFTYLIEA